MKKLLTEWRKFLKESTDVIESKNNSVVLFSDWAKGHVERGHKEPGLGSIFSKFNLGLAEKAIQDTDVSGEGGVYMVDVPGVGYDLVMPRSEAEKLEGAKKTQVEKEERGKKIPVLAYVTTEPLDNFKTNKLSVVIRPTTDLKFVPEDVKDRVGSLLERKVPVYSVLSMWPGRGDVPPASQWGNDWAIVIPK